jgi:hypothetical protein
VERWKRRFGGTLVHLSSADDAQFVPTDSWLEEPLLDASPNSGGYQRLVLKPASAVRVFIRSMNLILQSGRTEDIKMERFGSGLRYLNADGKISARALVSADRATFCEKVAIVPGKEVASVRSLLFSDHTGLQTGIATFSN